MSKRFWLLLQRKEKDVKEAPAAAEEKNVQEAPTAADDMATARKRMLKGLLPLMLMERLLLR